jgi:hypothetical protein
MGRRKKTKMTVYFHIQVDGNRGTCVTQFMDASASQRVLSRGKVHLRFALCTTVRYTTGV